MEIEFLPKTSLAKLSVLILLYIVIIKMFGENQFASKMFYHNI